MLRQGGEKIGVSKCVSVTKLKSGTSAISRLIVVSPVNQYLLKSLFMTMHHAFTVPCIMQLVPMLFVFH